jgi:single-stranded DNA-binding protein
MNMSASIFIKGRAAKDSTIISTKNGGTFLSLTVATNYKKQNEWFTNWYEVIYFGNDHQFLTIKKGDTVIVFGDEQHYTYKNRSGYDALKIQIIAKDLNVIPKSGDVVSNEETRKIPIMEPDNFDEEDVPF